MALILCLETSTTNCSVALAEDGKLLAKKEDNSPGYSHAEKLHLYIDAILKDNNAAPSDLNAVAVSMGPGSYTGLRIGVSAAKGLCFSLEIPLIAVSTLRNLAIQASEATGDFIVPLLDARRMEVYCAGYTSGLKELFPVKAEILKEQSFEDLLKKGMVSFIGDGVPKFQNICKDPNAKFILDRLPSAADMPVSAFEKYQKSQFEDVAYFEPLYLKEFLAG